MIRIGLFSFLLLGSLMAGAQEKTIQWKEVSITGIRKNQPASSDSLPETSKKVRLSPEGMPGLSIRQYGLSGSTSMAIRGAAARHTVVLWKGIPIENQSLGQMDASLIPDAMAETAELQSGASRDLMAGGAFGGTVVLGGSPKNRNGLRLHLKTGSFGLLHLHSQLGMAIGKHHVAFQAWSQEAHNQFDYRWEGRNHRQTHAHRRFRGLEGEADFYLRPNLRFVSAFWVQASHRELPASRHEAHSVAKQRDDNSHWVQELRARFRNGEGNLKWAHSQDFLQFEDARTVQFSQTRIQSNVFTGSLRRTRGAHEFRLEALLRNSRIPEGSYAHSIRENRLVGALAYEYRKRKVSFLVQPRWEQNHRSETGAQFLFTPVCVLKVPHRLGDWSLSIQRKGRFPSLSDVYWPGSGNRNLKPETGYGADLTWERVWDRNPKSTLRLQINPFASQIQHYIQWLPSGAVWTPENLPEVRLMGTESRLQWMKTWKKSRLQINQDISWTRATLARPRFEGDRLPGTQMAYTPVWQSLTAIRLDRKTGFMGLSLPYTGSRSLPSGQTNALPAFVLIHLQVGKTWTLNGLGHMELRAELRNLANTHFESVAGFVMPGRHGNLGFTFHFH